MFSCGFSTVRQILKCIAITKQHLMHISTHTWLCINLSWNRDAITNEMISTKGIQEVCINLVSGGCDGPQCIRIANSSLLEVLKKEDDLKHGKNRSRVMPCSI